MKYFILAIACLAITGCASVPDPTVRPVGPNQYKLMAETEFNYVEMVDGMYDKANKKCYDQRQTMQVLHTENGYGSVGMVGPKRGFSLYFTCQ